MSPVTDIIYDIIILIDASMSKQPFTVVAVWG